MFLEIYNSIGSLVNISGINCIVKYRIKLIERQKGGIYDTESISILA